MLNGVTQIVLTKIDVLNTFDEIDVCTAYNYDGAEQKNLPYDLDATEVNPVYVTLKGWKEGLESAMTYTQLPPKAQLYVEYLEMHLSVPFSIVSTSPDRNSLVFKSM